MNQLRLEIEELEERIAPTLTCFLGNGHSPVEVTITTDDHTVTGVTLTNPNHTHDISIHSAFGHSKAC